MRLSSIMAASVSHATLGLMRILVTGGAGYIGSVLVSELLAASHEVVVVDNFRYRQNSLALACADPKLQLHGHDVRDIAFVADLARGCDAVIPLAAYVGAPLCEQDPTGARSTNVDAALGLFRSLSKTQLLLMPTTNSAYGTAGHDRPCDESAPLNPVSAYARDKVEVEKALLERENSVSFRLATVFGMSPRMRLDLLVNDFTYRAMRDRFVVLFEGGFRRNYLHVRDAARVFLHALGRWEGMRGQIFNVGLSEANLSKRELCERIERQVSGFVFVDAPVGRDPDRRDYVISNAKIEATGFRPRHSIDDGIGELVKGYPLLSDTSRLANV